MKRQRRGRKKVKKEEKEREKRRKKRDRESGNKGESKYSSFMLVSFSRKSLPRERLYDGHCAKSCTNILGRH